MTDGDGARKYLDKYQVPAGPVRFLFEALVAHQDGGKLEAFELIVMQRTFWAMRDAIEDVYRPRSPLEAQLEYDRARNENLAQGIEWPEWIAAEDPVILERWKRWNEDR